jgi:hypothetical protein
MCTTAANLVERVLPEVDLRQWVLTFPFAWRSRLGQDGALLGTLTRLFVRTVHAFYAQRAAAIGVSGAKTGAVTVVQRTSSDLRLNPHLHVVFLDGTYHAQGRELAWKDLGRLETRGVGEVPERVVHRIDKHLCRHGLLASTDPDAEHEGTEDSLAASAVSGQVPPAGPQWLRGLSQPMAALVRITLKRAYADGTVAVEMDPLSLLCRLATSVPPPRFHTVKYAWRARASAHAAAASGRRPRGRTLAQARGQLSWLG